MILDIQKQVVSFEVAQKLKAVSVRQDSYFVYWRGQLKDRSQLMAVKWSKKEITAAYTVSELMRLIPNSSLKDMKLHILRDNHSFKVKFTSGNNDIFGDELYTMPEEVGISLANVLGSLLAKLVERGSINTSGVVDIILPD